MFVERPADALVSFATERASGLPIGPQDVWSGGTSSLEPRQVGQRP